MDAYGAQNAGPACAGILPGEPTRCAHDGRVIPRTQIFIISHERVAFCRIAIKSALEQTAEDFEIVVSDNSSSDAIQEMVLKEYPQVALVRRRPKLSALDHFKVVIEQARSPEIVLFHDDDVLAPNYLNRMRDALLIFPQAGAVACDAWIIRQDRSSSTRFMIGFHKTVQLNSGEDLLRSYLGFGRYRAAPFPGYLYRRDVLSGLFLDAQDGGKHADVSFLINIIERAPIVWVAEPLMHYRMHSTSDSAVEEVGQRLRLLRFIYRKTSIKKTSTYVQEFRLRYWLRWWRAARRTGSKSQQPWRYSVVSRYLFKEVFRAGILRPGLWLRIATALR